MLEGLVVVLDISLAGGLDVGLLALPLGLAVQDQFLGNGLELVNRGLSKQRVGHQREPRDRLALVRDDRSCGAVSFDDEQVDTQQLAHLGVVALVSRLERNRLRSRSQRSKWTL